MASDAPFRYTSSMNKRVAASIFLSILSGLALGLCTATLQFRQHPWIGGLGTPPSASGGRVSVSEEEFDFGKKDASEDGRHDFTLTNRGDRLLTLNKGATSCRCTVSEIAKSKLAPGESTQVSVTWRSKHGVGRFQQSVTVLTSDPMHSEVTFTIRGEYTQAVYVDPDEISFNQVSATDPVYQEARIFCNLPKQKIEIKGHELSDPSLQKFFRVDCSPLGIDELRRKEGATSGVLVRVTVKPGLPLGRFQERILLSTNLEKYSQVELPVFGSVGEITLVGAGWSSETGILDLGSVDPQKGIERELIVLRGERMPRT